MPCAPQGASRSSIIHEDPWGEEEEETPIEEEEEQEDQEPIEELKAEESKDIGTDLSSFNIIHSLSYLESRMKEIMWYRIL